MPKHQAPRLLEARAASLIELPAHARSLGLTGAALSEAATEIKGGELCWRARAGL
jgi:hypothetical protein